MDVEFKLQEIKLKEIEMKAISDFIKQERQSIAEYLCPFKVGQEVISKHGEHQIIADIKYKSFGNTYAFEVFKIKKEGKPYKDSCYVSCQSEYTAA
jgi:uncharacterized protein (DUF2147 family)